jgi:hypothetical protein
MWTSSGPFVNGVLFWAYSTRGFYDV